MAEEIKNTAPAEDEVDLVACRTPNLHGGNPAHIIL